MISPARAKAVVHSLASAGIDHVKVVTSGARERNPLPPEVLEAIISAARNHDLPVAAHAHFQLDQLCRCIDLRVDSIEQGFLLHEVKGGLDDMAINGVALCPTLRVIESIRSADDWYGQRVIPGVWWDALESTRGAANAGMYLLAGTDSGVFEVSPLDVWREIDLISAASSSRWTELQSATSTAARYLRHADLGTLQKGATADLVLVNANPLEADVGPNDIRAVLQASRFVAGDRVGIRYD